MVENQSSRLELRSVIKFLLSCENHVKFMEKYGMCTEKQVLVPSPANLQMG